MKLFRIADGLPNENSMRYFLRAYAECFELPVSEETVSNLMTETYMFEPLTWLEACIFFLALPMFKVDDTAKWNALAIDRWVKYQDTKHKLWKRQFPKDECADVESC